MKRDMDTVRELLIRIEAVELPVGTPTAQVITSTEITRPGEDPAAIAYHLGLLVDAGFVRLFRKLGPGLIAVSGLTWAGHDLLDSVRDPEIWRQTKEGASKAGGFTVDLLGDLAKGLIKTQVEKYTGIKL